MLRIGGLPSAWTTYLVAGVVPLLIVPSVTYVLARTAYALTVTQAELLRLIHTDDLTALHNRRSLIDQGQSLVHKAAQEEQVLGLLLLDVDNFKHVNDSFGHMAGDEALCYLAQQIRNCTHADDLVARFGGDEFAVLRWGATHMEMADLAAAIQANLIAAPFIYQNHPCPLSVSAGVADTEKADTFDALLSATDVALYKRKGIELLTVQNGRVADYAAAPFRLNENRAVL
ncbi:MAG: GGDEF domain-containing protein [Caldilineaceae bacterium]|nr:GGDEF domain-containing protein [Caldilineaceae bacterium]